MGDIRRLLEGKLPSTIFKGAIVKRVASHIPPNVALENHFSLGQKTSVGQNVRIKIREVVLRNPLIHRKGHSTMTEKINGKENEKRDRTEESNPPGPSLQLASPGELMAGGVCPEQPHGAPWLG